MVSECAERGDKVRQKTGDLERKVGDLALRHRPIPKRIKPDTVLATGDELPQFPSIAAQDDQVEDHPIKRLNPFPGWRFLAKERQLAGRAPSGGIVRYVTLHWHVANRTR